MTDCKHPPASVGESPQTPGYGHCNKCNKQVIKRNLQTHSVPCEQCGCPTSCKLVGDEYHCVCDVKTCKPCGWEIVKTIWFIP